MKKLLVCLLVMCLSCAGAEGNRRDYVLFYRGFSDGDMVAVQNTDGLWGFIDSTGREIVPCVWEYVEQSAHGRAVVVRNGLCGLIDNTGALILPCEWEMLALDVRTGGCVGWQGDAVTAFTADGEVLFTTTEYDYVGPVIRGVRCVTDEDRETMGFVAADGRIITPCQWAACGYFAGGLAWVRSKDTKLWGAIDESGTLVIPCRYQKVAGNFAFGAAMAYEDHAGWLVIDTAGNVLSAEAYEEAEEFCCGLAVVRRDGLFGYVNTLGEVAIPLVYTAAGDFSADRAVVRSGDERLLIDTTGRVIAVLPYDVVEPFRINGLAPVKTGTMMGAIDTEGRLVIPCEWERFSIGYNPEDVIVRAGRSGEYAFLNLRGELISGRTYSVETTRCSVEGDMLFLVEDGVLTIWNAEGEQLY